jgi:putative acetyltransferase
VATQQDHIVGHILFTPVAIVREHATPVPALALAPLAVLPTHQRAGVGSLLVRTGLAECQRIGPEQTVIVVGHANYYPRFGFRPARPLGLEIPFAADDDAFMVRNVEEVASEASTGLRGMVQYPQPFFDV